MDANYIAMRALHWPDAFRRRRRCAKPGGVTLNKAEAILRLATLAITPCYLWKNPAPKTSPTSRTKISSSANRFLRIGVYGAKAPPPMSPG